MLTQIDAQLRKDFPSKCTMSFGGCSIILVGDFRQLDSVARVLALACVNEHLLRTMDSLVAVQ